MASTIKEIHEKIIRETPVKDRLKGLSPKEILKVVPREEVLEEFAPEEIEAFLQKRARKKRKKSS